MTDDREGFRRWCEREAERMRRELDAAPASEATRAAVEALIADLNRGGKP